MPNLHSRDERFGFGKSPAYLPPGQKFHRIHGIEAESVTNSTLSPLGERTIPRRGNP
jgi:hypothetical protein